MPKPNTIKPFTVALIACALPVLLWPISAPLFLRAAYASYDGE